MKNLQIAFAVVTLLFTLGETLYAQDGNDISSAIPIYFDQIINDTIDGATRPKQVYSINLAKGQQISITAVGGAHDALNLFSPASRSVGTGTIVAETHGCCGPSWQVNYQVSVPGTYFISFQTADSGIAYKLQVTAQGTPIAVPNPTTAGCVTGQVDYLTYSLQLIAAGLPDEASIGGTKLCASCTVKPPAYKEIVDKMESAMAQNVGVSACYDTAGNIFQLKLIHP